MAIQSGFYRAKSLTNTPAETWNTQELMLSYVLGQMTGQNVLLDKNPVRVEGLTIKAPATG
jgi:hypothetical protein